MMIRMLWAIGLVYLIVVALISVAAAVITLEPHPKRMCLASEFRPDYSNTERMWCRRQW
jgi:hypothetical protein